MESILNLAGDLIDKSNNIPDDIRPIVKAICQGYIRETGGEISIEEVIRVCETKFTPQKDGLTKYDNKFKPFGLTDTTYDNDGKVRHEMEYICDLSDPIRLISNLTHEIGHVITERNANTTLNKDNDFRFPLVKKTADVYLTVYYDKEQMMCEYSMGYRMTDGFLESISSRIFASSEFREQIKQAGYDLQDYQYKDERLFPSRIYDEYKACYELFNFLTDGAIYDFAVKRFRKDKDIVDFVLKYNLGKIYMKTDKVNDTIWDLKPYEGKAADDEFREILNSYTESKKQVIDYALELKKAKEQTSNFDYDEFDRLLNNYKKIIEKQKELPIPESYKFMDDDKEQFTNFW